MLPNRALTVVVALAALLALTGCDDGPTAQAEPTAGPSGDPSWSQDTVRFPTYVALGDSYTAAPGVPQTDLTTGCARSDGNYPNRLAEALGADLVDVSCSGARTLDLVGAQRVGGGVVPAQFDALTPETSLVTLGIGGNDEQLFATLVGTCSRLAAARPDGAPCRDRMTSRGGDRLESGIALIRDRVTSALRGVRDRSPQATVVLVGYPQAVPARGTCPTLPLAVGDYAYVRSTTQRLNDALRAAAEAAGAEFIDVAAASEGHDVCAGDDAWVNGSQTDLTRAVAFHPFAAEQQAVTELILGRLG